MYVLWCGSDLFKAYHDPGTHWLDLVSSRSVEGGDAFSVGEDFTLSVDDTGAFCHLGLHAERGGQEELPERPDECRSAFDAEVELVETATPRWSLDPATGILRLAFEGIAIQQWGRIGDNLLWLALDDEGRLGAIVFEGVSRDPGGKGQAAWLEEVGT